MTALIDGPMLTLKNLLQIFVCIFISLLYSRVYLKHTAMEISKSMKKQFAFKIPLSPMLYALCRISCAIYIP
jgi:hypothetical protein